MCYHHLPCKHPLVLPNSNLSDWVFGARVRLDFFPQAELRCSVRSARTSRADNSARLIDQVSRAGNACGKGQRRGSWDNTFPGLLLGCGDGVFVICTCLRVPPELQEKICLTASDGMGSHKNPIGRSAQCAAANWLRVPDWAAASLGVSQESLSPRESRSAELDIGQWKIRRCGHRPERCIEAECWANGIIGLGSATDLDLDGSGYRKEATTATEHKWR